MKKLDFPIDVVITWVDESDKKWYEKKNKFLGKIKGDSSEARYRDYGTLKYVFRSIEKNAPWINKIFFVTDHQTPTWLETDSSKLVLVNHEDFIDKKCLPTFNSNVIDLFFDQIPNLSEHFIYFNDDMFLNKKTKATDFFDHKGNPRDTLGLNIIMPIEDFDHIHANNMELVNKQFQKFSVIKRFPLKFFNIQNFEWNLLTLLQLPWPRFSRFYDSHVPLSYRKSAITTVLNDFPQIREKTMNNRFRSKNDYSLWIVRYFQMMAGKFTPRSAHFGKRYGLKEVKKIIQDLTKEKHALICINDSQDLADDEYTVSTAAINAAFKEKFEKKCSFEKNSV